MPRLSATLLALSLAILGSSLPGLACAAMPADDCCPGDSAPCMDVAPQLAMPAPDCCATAPGPAQWAARALPRGGQAASADGTGPDLHAAPAAANGPQAGTIPARELPALEIPASRDASRTYLTTRRLRL